ncbi:MAG TPA: histidine phosphatase family protein [Anaerolineae bacterium]|nr:histidine phosphatase family protein [Anaerolineae bacterium]
MKKIFLMRHAKSSWKNSKLPDHERPLKKRGQKNAKSMGKFLKAKKHVPDIVLCSTAERAVQTANILTKACGYDKEVIYTDKLYMAEPSNIFEILHDQPDKAKNIMIIGHNPGMEAFLQILTGKVETLPTASIAYLNLSIKKWANLNQKVEAKLKKLWRPKDL